MHLRRRKSLIKKILFTTLTVIIIGLVASGCVRGLQPLGWSGGRIDDGMMYVGSKEGKLVEINLADEGRIWSEPLKSSGSSGGFGCAPTYGAGCSGAAPGVAIYGTPVVSGDLVYIGGYNGKIYAYNKISLELRWVYPREGNIDPVVGGGVVALNNVYFGDSSGKLYALDAATGEKRWEFETGDKIWSTPAADGDTLYVSSFDKKLYALNAADGSVKWEYETEGAIFSTPLVNNGTICIGSFDRHLYAINAADGSLKWRFMGQNWFWTMPAIYANTIYAGCLDGKVYALRVENGAKVTEFALDSPAASSPVVNGSSIIFTSRKGVVYIINAENNEIKPLVEMDVEVYGPLAIKDDILYVHTADLTLHRINVVTGAILRSISLKSSD